MHLIRQCTLNLFEFYSVAEKLHSRAKAENLSRFPLWYCRIVLGAENAEVTIHAAVVGPVSRTPFYWESQSEAECRANFRVEKHHIPLVEDALQIPQYFVCTWLLVDMEFLFSCSTRHLTSISISMIIHGTRESKISGGGRGFVRFSYFLYVTCCFALF